MTQKEKTLLVQRRTFLHGLGMAAGYPVLNSVAAPLRGLAGTWTASDYALASRGSLWSAATRGDAEAQYELGVIQYLGSSGLENVGEARRWWRLAAEQGHSRAQYELGLLQLSEPDGPTDREEAKNWLKLAADQNDIAAQRELGMLFQCPCSSCRQERWQWLRLAAEQGDMIASLWLPQGRWECGWESSSSQLNESRRLRAIAQDRLRSYWASGPFGQQRESLLSTYLNESLPIGQWRRALRECERKHWTDPTSGQADDCLFFCRTSLVPWLGVTNRPFIRAKRTWWAAVLMSDELLGDVRPRRTLRSLYANGAVFDTPILSNINYYSHEFTPTRSAMRKSVLMNEGCFPQIPTIENDSKSSPATSLAVDGDADAFQLDSNMVVETPQDDAERARHYRVLAATTGDASAQFEMAVLTENGAGVTWDDTEAARWYRLAAEQGYAEAQFRLGIRYYWGVGVPGDLPEAARWLTVAGEHGHAAAIRSLPRVSPVVTTVNLCVDGRDFVLEDALQRMNGELYEARLRGTKIVRLVHGGFPSGWSGQQQDLQQGVRRRLETARVDGTIKDFVRGEDVDHSAVSRKLRARFPQLPENGWGRREGNPHFTLVVL